MMRGVRVGAWSGGERPDPEPVLDGISFYLEGVPAGTVLLGTTGRVYSASSPVIVDWGDGTKSTIAYATVMRIPTHTYEVGGDYVINITGEDITQINAYSGLYWPIFTETRASGLPYIKKFTISRDYPINLGTASNASGHLFRKCSGLSEVRLGAVKLLGNYCFAYCSGLTSVTIPSSVTSLGVSCFSGCTGLTSIDIPSSVTSLGDSCFSGCTGLTSVTIPSGVTAVGRYCFSECSGLTSVTIPSSVTSIGVNCFRGCTARIDFYGTTGRTRSTDADNLLGECEVHVHQEIVPEYLFKNVTSQFDLVIEDSVTELGNRCFYGCTGLTSVDIPSSVTKLGIYCFSGCTGLTSVDIPSSVTELGSSCFSDCTGLTSLTIPSSVTKLTGFNGCTGLTSVTIPSSVTELSGFSGCTGLTSVTIPSGVTYIDNGCFSGCTARIDLYGYHGMRYENSGGDIYGNCEVHIHGEKDLGSRFFAAVTSECSVVIEDGVESLGSYCFTGCRGITSVKLPASVVDIGGYCFMRCTNLTSIVSLSEVPPKAEGSAWNGVDTSLITVYVPSGAASAYRASPGWKDVPNIQELQ